MKSFVSLTALCISQMLLACGGSSSAVSAHESKAKLPKKEFALCKSTENFADYGFTVKVLSGSDGAIEMLISNQSIIGPTPFKSLSHCKVTPPPEGTADGATLYSCHDGGSSNTTKVNLFLGGFIPTIGAGTVLKDGPKSFVEVSKLSCNLDLN